MSVTGHLIFFVHYCHQNYVRQRNDTITRTNHYLKNLQKLELTTALSFTSLQTNFYSEINLYRYSWGMAAIFMSQPLIKSRMA